jgi:hypothetical protein
MDVDEQNKYSLKHPGDLLKNLMVFGKFQKF